MNWPFNFLASGITPTARPGAGDWVVWMPWVNAGLMVGAVIAMAASVGAAAQAEWLVVAAAFMCALVTAMVVWFVRAFTFPIDEIEDRDLLKRYRQQIFIFAYAFTFIAFAVVLMPAGFSNAPGKADRTATNQVTQRPMLPFTFFYGCFNYPSGTAIATNRLDCGEGVRNAFKSAPDKPADLDKGSSYALLLAVGGPAGRSFGDAPYYAVSGGLVLPVYVVLIALIGGAISLSRRIPEIQKRADPNFPGTATQCRLMLYEAREQVIFQIMQLVSAPFIAICSFHIIEPPSSAATVALAFACGFASESILLMIRSVVEKIRPGSTITVANEQSTLSGTVVDEAGKPLANAAVRVLQSGDAGHTAQRAVSDSAGRFLLQGVARRKVTVEAAFGALLGCEVVDASAPDQADLKITLKAVPQQPQTPADGAVDGDRDADADAGTDAGAGADAGPVADAGADAGADAAPDAAADAVADAGSATLKGLVLDTLGQPVADVAITLQGAPSRVVSDADGGFTLAVPAGTATLQAMAADGVREGLVTVDAQPGAEADVRIVVS